MIDQDNHAQPSTCTTKHYQDNMTRCEVLWSPIFGVNIMCHFAANSIKTGLSFLLHHIHHKIARENDIYFYRNNKKKLNLFFSHVILVFTCHFFTKFTVTWISPGTQHC